MKYVCNDIEVQNFLGKVDERNSSGKKISFSLFHVKCLGLVTTYVELASLKPILNILEQRITDKIPAIVVLDELDAFSPERREQSEYLAYWSMDFMKKRHGGLVIFGIVNHPDKLDLAVYRQFEHLFYFGLPDEITVAKILQHERIPHHNEIARRLCTNPVDAGELMHGCRRAIHFLGKGDSENLKTMKVEELADFIEDHLKITWGRVRRYRLKYDYYINKAKNHMALWKDRKRTLLGH